MLPVIFSKFKEKVALAPYCKLKIGGPAKYFYTLTNPEELPEIILGCQKEEIPYYFLGSGSNVLFPDSGYNGLVIINEYRGAIDQERDQITVKSESF